MNIVQCVVEEHGKLPSKFEFATSNRTCTAYFVAVGWVWGWRISSSSSKAWLTHLSLSSSSFLQCCLQPTLPDVYETQSSVQPPVEKQTDNYVPVWTKKQKAHLSLVLFTNHGPGNNVAKEDIKSDNRNRRLYIYLGLLLPPHKNGLFGGTFPLPGPVYLSWKWQHVIFFKFLLKRMFNCTLQKNKVLIWYFRDKT